MRLHKSPIGLLGAFDLKALGRAPTEFSETVLGITDVSDFYFQPNRGQFGASASVTAAGSAFAAITVPLTEIWRIKAWSVNITRDAADVALTPRLEVHLRRGSTAGGVVPWSVVLPAVAATDLTQADGLWLPRTLLLSPGDTIVGILRTTMSAAAGCGLNLDADVFPV